MEMCVCARAGGCGCERVCTHTVCLCTCAHVCFVHEEFLTSEINRRDFYFLLYICVCVCAGGARQTQCDGAGERHHCPETADHTAGERAQTRGKVKASMADLELKACHIRVTFP